MGCIDFRDDLPENEEEVLLLCTFTNAGDGYYIGYRDGMYWFDPDGEMLPCPKKWMKKGDELSQVDIKKIRKNILNIIECENDVTCSSLGFSCDCIKCAKNIERGRCMQLMQWLETAKIKGGQ